MPPTLTPPRRRINPTMEIVRTLLITIRETFNMCHVKRAGLPRYACYCSHSLIHLREPFIPGGTLPPCFSAVCACTLPKTPTPPLPLHLTCVICPCRCCSVVRLLYLQYARLFCHISLCRSEISMLLTRIHPRYFPSSVKTMQIA